MIGDEPILSVEAGREPVIVVRPVYVVLDVLFAAPDNLHRSIDLLRDRHCLSDAVHVQSPSEPATEQMVMNLDPFGREAGNLRGRGPVSYTHLTLPTIYSV